MAASALVPAVKKGDEKKEDPAASLDELLTQAIENVAELAEEFEKKGSENIYVMERQFEMKQGRVTTNSKGKKRYQEGDSYALDETLERLTVDGEVCNEKRSMEMSARKGPEKKKQKKSKNEKEKKKTEEKDEEKEEQEE